MRIRLLALILASAGALVFLGLSLTASAASTPENTVRRLLQPNSVADACGSLAPAERGKGFRSCYYARGPLPEAQHLVISHVYIRGTHATLKATYDYGLGNEQETHYRLAQQHGRWLITGTFLPVYTIRHP